MRQKSSLGSFQYTRALSKLASVTVVLSLLAPAMSNSEVLFEESFDDLPDYTSSEELNLPGWDYRRNGEVNWSPENGHPDKHDAFEILAANADKARGGSGKSFVAWRESYNPGWKQWNSDGILAKKFAQEQTQLYVSFYVRFADDWTPGGGSKLFRTYHWNQAGSLFQFFEAGNAGPIFFWDYNKNDYGVRNFQAYRGGPPQTGNYAMSNNDVLNPPRSLINLGDTSLNFTYDTSGMGADGSTPKIIDQINGGYISDNMSQTVSHAQIFGQQGHWTKMAFFLKMNSAPGLHDGEMIQWINDEQILVNKEIRWVKESEENQMVGWNVVAIGGNDFWRDYPNSERREEWYSIDDVYIATEIPSDVLDGNNSLDESKPNPPQNLTID